jgi:hypothetical protein
LPPHNRLARLSFSLERFRFCGKALEFHGVDKRVTLIAFECSRRKLTTTAEAIPE